MNNTGRAAGNDLTEILNALRSNRIKAEHVKQLKSRCLDNPGGLTELHCHNADIDRINQAKLDALESKERVFLGEKISLGKDKTLVEQLVKNCLGAGNSPPQARRPGYVRQEQPGRQLH